MSIQGKQILLVNNQGLDESGGGVTIIKVLIEYFARYNRVSFLSEGAPENSAVQENLKQIKIQLPPYETQAFFWRFAPILRSRFLKHRLQGIVSGYDLVIVLDCKYFPAIQHHAPNSLKIYLSLSAIPMVAVRDAGNSTVEKILAFLQYAWLERYAFHHAAISIVASQKHLAEVQKYERIRTTPFVVYPFLRTYTLSQQSEPQRIQHLKQELRLEGKRIVLTVSRITPLKNLEYVIELAAQLERDDVAFLIVGDGGHRPALETLADSKQVRHKVIFAGNREQPGSFYQMADLYLHPSHYESFSFAIYEAMLSGLPVIFPKNSKDYVSAFEELVTPDDALCLDFQDQRQVKDAMLRLLADEAFRVRVGSHAKQKARSFEHAYPPYAEQIEQFIQEYVLQAEGFRKMAKND